jgi:hypothetical protein
VWKNNPPSSSGSFVDQRDRRDAQTGDEIARDRQAHMAEEYATYDRSLAESWRTP